MSPLVDWAGLSALAIGDRVAISGGLVVVLVVAVVAARIAWGRLGDERGPPPAVAVGLAVAVLAVGAIVAGSLLSVWGQLPTVDAVLAAANIGNPLGVATGIAGTVLVLAAVYVATSLIERFVYDYTQNRTAITQHQQELVYRTSQVSLYVVAALVLFSIWGVNLGGILVGAGFLGIVVGLAARQTLGSLIAGFVLMFARPFEIGDWVQIGDREGIVTEISIVNTRIQTFDGEYAMIPNDTVSANEVINRTRKGRLRVQIEVGVDYATDLEEAVEVSVAAMREVDDVLAVPQPRTVLKRFDDSAITLGLRFWIDNPTARRKWRAQTAVIAEVKAAFDAAGIKIPFPQRELTGRAEAGGFRVDGPAGAAPLDPGATGSAEAAGDGESTDDADAQTEPAIDDGDG